MNNIAPEQIAQNFKAMGDSVWLINAVIANTTMRSAPVAEKKAIVERNVVHLELMRAQDYWTTQNFAAVDSAIAAGKAYVAA